MQNIIEEKKQEIKNKIKNFFNENNIQYREVKEKLSERIEIQGKIFSTNLLPYPEINMLISRDEVITVKDREKELNIVYYRAFPEESRIELKIKKNEFEIALVGIYYYNNKLVFLF